MSDACQQLTFGNRELIEHCYTTGVHRGLQHPIVIVIDMADAAGREHALSQMDEESRHDQTRLDALSVVIKARPRPAISEFDIRSLAHSVLLHTESSNLFAVVVISDGGISWAAFPIV